MPLTTSAWLDRFFDHYFRRRPVSATFIGRHEYDGDLPDYSPAGVATTLRETRELLDLIEIGDVEPPTTQWEAVDRLLARNFLMTQVWELSNERVLLGNPCVYTGEAVFGVVSLLLRDYAPFEERVEALARRLPAIPELLEQGLRRTTNAPKAWIEKSITECKGAEHLLTDGLKIATADKLSIRKSLSVPAESALAAFRNFRGQLESRLAGAADEGYGCGSDAFDMLMQRGHCVELNGQQVSEYAFKRLADARQLMADAAQQIEPTADPRALVARLADIHPTAADYYPAYQREFDAAKAFAAERELLTWPDYPIIFQPIPDWARTAAPNLYFLFYRAPAPFDRHVTQRYLVTPVEPDMPVEEQDRRLRSTNLSQIRMNHVIHHGGIGHHVQNWWAYRAESRVGQMAAVDCSLRIAMLAGGTMAEGWACYATDLMAEQGYLSPLEELSEHNSLGRMAARAIVDVGLHNGDLDFDAAVGFYRDEIGMPPAASRAEAIKNSMFPAAAMMYLIGTDAIHDLRAAMRQSWGDAFSLRRFHDDFLRHGSIPVALTSRLMLGLPIEQDGFVSPAQG